MSDRQGIEIDYCPQCRGVWLDRGELDKIIERTAAPAPSAPPSQAAPQAPYPQQGYGHQPHHGYKDYRYKKPKHWLKEIFD
jgi:Zn-finger nucleic acid-binding protein